MTYKCDELPMYITCIAFTTEATLSKVSVHLYVGRFPITVNLIYNFYKLDLLIPVLLICERFMCCQLFGR